MEAYRVGNFGEPEAEVARLMQQAEVVVRRERLAMVECGMPLLGRGLDVGCGPGHVGAGLMAAHPGLEIHGVDVDPFSVGRAAVALRSARQVDCSGVAPLVDPPYQKYDFAYSRLFLRHLQYPLAAVLRQMDVVRPGGWIGAVDVSDASLVLDPWTPAAQAVTHLRRAWFKERGCDGSIGHKLPGLFSRAGLRDLRVRPVVVDSAEIGAPAFAQVVLVPFLQAAAEAEGDHLSGKVADAERFFGYWAKRQDSYGAITLWVVGGRAP